MMELLYAEENTMVCEAVSIQYRSASDGQTDGQTEFLYQYRACNVYSQNLVKMCTTRAKSSVCDKLVPYGDLKSLQQGINS